MHFSSQQRACALHAELQCICRNMCFWERRALFSTGRALRRPGLMDAADEMQRDVVSIMAILLMSTTEFLTDNHGAVFKAASQLQPAAAAALRRGHPGVMHTVQHCGAVPPACCCIKAASSCWAHVCRVT